MTNPVTTDYSRSSSGQNSLLGDKAQSENRASGTARALHVGQLGNSPTHKDLVDEGDGSNPLFFPDTSQLAAGVNGGQEPAQTISSAPTLIRGRSTKDHTGQVNDDREYLEAGAESRHAPKDQIPVTQRKVKEEPENENEDADENGDREKSEVVGTGPPNDEDETPVIAPNETEESEESEESEDSEDSEESEESAGTDGEPVDQIAAAIRTEEEGTPPPPVQRDDVGWISDVCRSYKFRYRHKMKKQLPLDFDWRDLAYNDSMLTAKFYSYTDTGLEALIRYYGGYVPYPPSCVKSTKGKRSQRWGEWFFQQLLHAIREGKCKVKHRAKDYVLKKIVWSTEKQRGIWKAKGITWPISKFTQTKKHHAGYFYGEPLRVPSESGENEVFAPKIYSSVSKHQGRDSQPTSATSDEDDDADHDADVEEPDDDEEAGLSQGEDHDSTEVAREETVYINDESGEGVVVRGKVLPMKPARKSSVPVFLGAKVTERRRIPSSMPGAVPFDDSGPAFWRPERRIGTTLLEDDETNPISSAHLNLSASKPSTRMSQFDRFALAQPQRESLSPTSESALPSRDPPHSGSKTTLQSHPRSNTTIARRVSQPNDLLAADQPAADQPHESRSINKAIESIDSGTILNELGAMADPKPQEKIQKEMEFILCTPSCGWGIVVRKAAPELPEGMRYWTPEDSANIGDEDKPIYIIPTETDRTPDWPVFSYSHNTSDDQRESADWRPAPFTLPDEQTIFLIILLYNVTDRYKRWPYTFNKSGMPRANRPTFGIPPIAISGRYNHDESFRNSKYFYLTYKEVHTLRGQDGSNKFTGATWKEQRNLSKGNPDWTFGADIVDDNSLTRVSPGNDGTLNLRLWYTVDGRENREFVPSEIQCSHPAAWEEKLRKNNKAPVCTVDEVFGSQPADAARRSTRTSGSSTPNMSQAPAAKANVAKPGFQILVPSSLRPSPVPQSAERPITPNRKNTPQSPAPKPQAQSGSNRKRSNDDLAALSTKKRRLEERVLGSESTQTKSAISVSWLKNLSNSQAQYLPAPDSSANIHETFVNPELKAMMQRGSAHVAHNQQINNVTRSLNKAFNRLQNTLQDASEQVEDILDLKELLEHLVETNPLHNTMNEARDFLDNAQNFTTPGSRMSAAKSITMWYERHMGSLPEPQIPSGLEQLQRGSMVTVTPPSQVKQTGMVEEAARKETDVFVDEDGTKYNLVVEDSA